MDVYFLLLWEESSFRRIAHSQKAYKLVAFGSVDYFLDLFRFVGHGDVEHSAETLVGSGKEHVFKGTPCRCKIIERALLHRMKQGRLPLMVKWYDEQAARYEHTLLFGQSVGITLFQKL